MKYIFLLIVILVSKITIFSQTSGSGYMKLNSECLGTEMDGSLTLKSWGSGRNYSDALEQAKKNAVYEVIFKGIKEGDNSCSRSALLVEVNAEKKHEEYFAQFFSDNGPYKEFVSLKDERIGHKFKRDKKRRDVTITESAVVRVQRLLIKKKLVRDNIMINYIEQ